jgi:predicted DNA-binding WGR domain protein
MLLSWLKDHRFYNVQLQANLFGGTSVFCSWGSRYGKRGGYKIIFCDNELDVANTLQAIKKRRKVNGYILTD